LGREGQAEERNGRPQTGNAHSTSLSTKPGGGERCRREENGRGSQSGNRDASATIETVDRFEKFHLFDIC